MWVQEPDKLMAVDEKAFEARMRWQQSRMNYALSHAGTQPGAEVLGQAAAGLQHLTGVWLSAPQLQDILALYPVERSLLCCYGWSGNDIRDLVLDVIANYFLSSRWPTPADAVSVDNFTARLQKAAEFMGYAVAARPARTESHP